MTEAATPSSPPNALRLQRRFDAKPSRLYRYFTEADHLVQWFGPKGVCCRAVVFEAKVGLDYQIVFLNPDGSEVGLVGRFLQLEEPRLIQMTWRWQRPDETEPGEETLVTIRLSEVGSGALLKLTHERFGEASERDRHDAGWSSSFDCLEAELADPEARG